MVSATAITPTTPAPTAKNSGVLPSSAKRSASCSNSPKYTPCCCMSWAFPITHTVPSYTPATPPPGIWRNSLASATRRAMLSARETIARPSGCSDFFSRAAATRSSSFASTPVAHSMSVTSGEPLVMVPVLSSTTVFTSWAVCSASAVFAKMPARAPRPVPTIMAHGVARPSAHGQLITSTETAWVSEVDTSPDASIHTTKVTSAMPITAGTKIPLILSASFSMGALVEVASSTIRIMPASAVSSPTRSTRMANHPVFEMVAPITPSPDCFSTGTLSPVSADSSTAAEPSTTVPSSGTAWPARTTSTSPTCTCSRGTSTSASPSRRVATLGERSRRDEIASVVLPFARASKYLPSVMSVKIMPADSKYKSITAICAASMSPAPIPMPMR